MSHQWITRTALCLTHHDIDSIAITGLVVLGGHTSVPDPHANFRNAFDGKSSAYGVTNALVKIIFAYAGYENAFNLVNEVKVCSPLLLNVGQELTGALTESGQTNQAQWVHCIAGRHCTLFVGKYCILCCW